MIRRWSPLALLLLGILTGCESVVEPVPESLPAGEASRQLGSLQASDVVRDAEGREYTLVKGQIPSLPSSLESTKIIGLEGGSVHLLGHTLSVPAGAVTRPTLFVLGVLPNGYVQVELLALVADPFRGLLDVGERGFARPVRLSLTYAWASNVADPSRLTVLHLRGDGVAEPVPTVVDAAGKTVTATLEHFSRYCMAMP